MGNFFLSLFALDHLVDEIFNHALRNKLYFA